MDERPDLSSWWNLDEQTLYARLDCTGQGLNSLAVSRRQAQAPPRSRLAGLWDGARFLLRRFASPLVLILLIAGSVSASLGEMGNALIIAGIVLVSVTLDAFQEARSAQAALKLQQSVAQKATVVRDGQQIRIPAASVVPGDLLVLEAGDIIAADAWLVSSRHLQVNQALLTGESFPVEKRAVAPEAAEQAIDAPRAILAGTAIHSGNATAIAVLTGAQAELGRIGAEISKRETPTAFDTDIQRFGYFIMRLTVFLVLFVLLVNALFHRPWLESFLFAIALAVGLTPELLPMVVSVTLARGAIRLARKHVIVKQLPVIQNLGTMDVFCTDKTGTLTEARIRLDRTVDVAGKPSDGAATLLQVNSRYSAGAKSALDDAVLSACTATLDAWTLLAQLPFDFDRRWAGTLVHGPSGVQLIVKGAPEDVLRLCTSYAPGGDAAPAALTEAVRQQTGQTLHGMESDGFRVLAIASKRLADSCASAEAGEASDMVLHGYAAFADPPKRGAASALRALRARGVQVKVISGDSELVTRHVCAQLHLPVEGVLTGAELASMDTAALRGLVEKTTLFCRMTPAQKERVVLACKHLGHTVGYMGDGINDAPALHAADVGISVESATDVAREAASVILLRRSLGVVHDGVMEGRRTYMNVFKYIMMGTSSNFGNMFSMAGAALFLPFLPMLPVQILLNNMLYDLSELPIPLDNVDAEDVASPRRLDIGLIRRFMVTIGPVSSAFDFITFYLLLHVLNATEAEFQTCWFVESLCTQVLVIFVIRTRANPFRSRPQGVLVAACFLVVAVALWLPLGPLSGLFSFVSPPPLFYLVLGPLVACYLAAVQEIKRRFFLAEFRR
ncbi:magnesium-translocating P-type ATPase [Achromobacter anxifer]|uniref:magnesium-translocating P-type ATPase n=1 Tax=Achromobacter anxifer TaxID=1287737 RepID=UPI0023F894DE|nr:magnesium-translocating P-type ATPase [Achromobacter anxifer]MDF8364096.1 magnesium-translocating P-type ATPase [Achromobacter anxifer]